MKVIVYFLLMLASSNLVSASDTTYFPSHLRFCSSCIIKLPSTLTKTEFCNKKANSNLCEMDEVINRRIRILDAFNECVIKSYNSVLDKFKDRGIKIEETVNEKEATVEWERSEGYESDDTYRYTTCLGAPYGKYVIYRDSKMEKAIIKTETKKQGIKVEKKDEIVKNAEKQSTADEQETDTETIIETEEEE